MAHLVHSINVTVNGGCHHEDVVADIEHHEYALALLESASFVVLGRKTFDLFEDFWPAATTRRDLPPHVTGFARELGSKRKYVLSSRELGTDWENTFLLRGPGLDPLRKVLATAAGKVVVFGSPSLGASLATAGLLDELHVVLQPIISVAGRKAYEGVEARPVLSLIDSRQFASGVVLLRYAAKTVSG